MKFGAKINCKREEDAQQLVRAFFVHFNRESSIMIKNQEAMLEVFFDEKPPMKIIDAICNCEITEFSYGEGDSEEELSEQPQQKVLEEISKQQLDTRTAEEDVSENPDKISERVLKKPKKEETAKVVIQKTIDIPKLEEIVQKSKSFEDFVKLVAEWLEMDTKQELFKDLVIATSELEKVSWKEIEKSLEDKEITFKQWEKIFISRKVSEKLEGVKILHFLNAMKRYKDYSFAKSKLKMKCMPECKHFEEVLATVDKTKPIEDRVRYVLNSMGLNKKNDEEYQEILKIANASVRLREIDWNNIFLKADIVTETSMNDARLILSEFINNFARKYDSNTNVKVLDFLRELQGIVTLEHEIES